MKLNLRLNGRYKRSIKTNIIFYISASLLTMLCVMAFALLYTCGIGIKNYVNNMFETCVVEDANVVTVIDIEPEEIDEISSTYHVLMEKQESLNVLKTKTLDKNGKVPMANDTHARIFKNNTKINKYVITETSPNVNIKTVNDLKDDEIIINEKYANRHNISLDSDKNRIFLNDVEFKVVGYFVRPDYLNGLESETDSYANYDSFFIAYVNDHIYEEFKGEKNGEVTASSYYSLKYDQGGKTDIEALRKYLFNEYITIHYNASNTSGRITVFYTRPNLFISFSFLFLLILPAAVVSIIAIILNIKVKNDQKIIGTIQALGYRDNELCYHYSIMSLIPGIVGGVLMTILIYASVGFFGKLSTGDFEVMRIDFIYPWYMAVLGIVVPSLIYMVASIFTIKRLIKKPITDLLRGAGKKSKSSNFLVNKKMPIIRKFSLRSLIINKGRTFVVFLGIMSSALIIGLSLMMLDTIDAIVTTAMKKAGDFEYEYTLKMPMVAEDEQIQSSDTNYLIASVYEYNNRIIPLMGASEDDMDLWYTTLEDGTKITKLDDNSFYMSKLCAELMGVKAGDTVTINSNFNTEKLTFKVSGIIDNGLISYILTNKANVIDSYFRTIYALFDDTELDQELLDILKTFFESEDASALNSLYNIVLSKKPLDNTFEAANLVNIFEKSSIEKQKDARMRERMPIIYLVLIIGISICVIAVFTVVNVIIEDNQGNISMLMVLGYKPNEINRMIINGNHILVPLGIATGLPLAYLILILFFKRTVKVNNIVMPVTMKFTTGLIIIAIIVATYTITLFALKMKARNVSMTDSLKDNR